MRTAPKYIVSVIVLILVCVVPAGCGGGWQRELIIKTEPAEALVVLNDEEIGLSPVTVSFNWYGDYSVRVSKEGYQSLNTHRELKAPWYDGFPFDFIASFLWPKRTADSYEWTFELTPYEPPQRDALIDSAQKFQTEATADFQKPPASASLPPQ